MKRFLLLALVLVLGITAAALAHDTWMLAFPRDGGVSFTITSGMDFPRNEVGPKANRVATSGWRLGEASGELGNVAEGDSMLTLAATIKGAGTAVAWVTFHPREIDLDEDDVTHYLDEIGAPDALRQAWESAGPDRTWHEVYTKHTKAIVRVGGVPDDAACAKPVGLAIELVPARDPTALAAGDVLEIRVLKGGQPFGGFAVGAVCGADGEASMQTTDGNGVVRFAIHHTGPWLVRGTDVRREKDGTWSSDFTTLTFTAGGK